MTANDLHFDQALLRDGWTRNVRVSLAGGLIGKIEAGVAPRPAEERHAVGLPGMTNLHSHAFQRAMAGLTELRGPTAESFWTWREKMYGFALALTPDQIEAIARQLYVEMLEAGFTRVGEFHYLHHDINGHRYGNIAEMAERIAAAAAATGIGLTLMPVFYAHSNFGGAAPTDGQRRFVCDLDGFARLLAAAKVAVAAVPGGSVGVAPHSLRAVTPFELKETVALVGDGPIHIHIAEQVKEVDDCIAHLGSRPVNWLLDHAPVDPRWTLIHATHTTPDEIVRLATSGATAGLCPITEANLGDGVFDAAGLVEAGGAFGIGSDSNVEIGVGAELRQLEYAQRLRLRARNVISCKGSTGRSLYDLAIDGGSRSLGMRTYGLEAGAAADIVTLNRSDPLTAHLQDDEIIDAWIFGGKNMVDCVWVRGEKLVAQGRHRERNAATRGFFNAIKSLGNS